MVAGFMTAVTLSGVIGGPVDRRDRENRPAEPRLRIDHLAGRAGDRREPVAGLLPGVSRSAATICGGMLCHLERPSAARFSFLMSVPVLIAAAVLAVKDLLELPGFATYLPPLAAGFAASAVFGFASIHWLLSYLARHPMNLFAWYRLLIGAGCFLLYAYRT
jgi:undecaprenyl-diphosphatase